MWAKPKQPSGFTIVELLIVIVVIGILAAITIVAYSGIQSRAHAAQAQAAANSVGKLLGIAYVTNGTYPNDLSTVNSGRPISTNDGTSYLYHPTNDNANYCVTVTNATTSYMVTDTNPTPTSGGCPGDGVGGMAARTNFIVNPSFEANLSGWSSGGTNTRDTSVYSNGVASAKIFNNGGAGYLFLDVPTTANDTWTLSADVRTVGTNGTTWTMGIQAWNASSSLAYYSVVIPSTQATFTRRSITTPPLPAGTISIRVFPAWNGWINVVGDGVYVDAVLLEKSASASSYADGNSPSWIWNGTTNISTSTGPAL